MKEMILITAMAALTACGGAVGGTNSGTGNLKIAANTNASNTVAAVPKKTSEPFAMHAAPKLIELVKKYKDTIDSDLDGKDLIVIGRAWDVQSDGIYLNSISENVTCLMSADAMADQKYKDLLAKKSQNPIVEVRGTFKSATISSDVWVRLEDCTIVSLPSSSGS